MIYGQKNTDTGVYKLSYTFVPGCSSRVGPSVSVGGKSQCYCIQWYVRQQWARLQLTPLSNLFKLSGCFERGPSRFPRGRGNVIIFPYLFSKRFKDVRFIVVGTIWVILTKYAKINCFHLLKSEYLLVVSVNSIYLSSGTLVGKNRTILRDLIF